MSDNIPEIELELKCIKVEGPPRILPIKWFKSKWSIYMNCTNTGDGLPYRIRNSPQMAILHYKNRWRFFLCMLWKYLKWGLMDRFRKRYSLWFVLCLLKRLKDEFNEIRRFY